MSDLFAKLGFSLWSFSPLFRVCAQYVTRFRNQQGTTLIEIIVVLGMISITLGIGAANFKNLSSDIQNATSEVQGFIKQTRARAIGTTMAYRVVTPTGDDSRVIAEFARSCNSEDEEFTEDQDLVLELPAQIRINPIVGLCFNPRGISLSNAWVSLSTRDWAHASSLEVGLAGSVKVHKW